jgi:hypothetical protein
VFLLVSAMLTYSLCQALLLHGKVLCLEIELILQQTQQRQDTVLHYFFTPVPPIAMLMWSLSPQHTVSSGCGWRRYNIWSVTVNILNKQLQTTDKGMVLQLWCWTWG